MKEKSVLVVHITGRTITVCTNKKIALQLINDLIKERKASKEPIDYNTFSARIKKNGHCEVYTDFGTIFVIRYKLNEIYPIDGVTKF
jgi:hypothetical protein